MGIVVSLKTIPRRYKYFLSALRSIAEQSYLHAVEKIVVNIDDDLSAEDKAKYGEDVLSEKCGIGIGKISVKERPVKWKSASKLVFTYKEHHDDVIICFDDDGIYDRDCIKQLVDSYFENQGCIICQQANPIIVDRGKHRIEYMNYIDVKLKQTGFSKYCSRACLFPPNCFSDLLFDYEKFKYMTDCNHDELWLWSVSTLNGTHVVSLDNLGYFHYDYSEDICDAEMKDGLGINYNGNPDAIKIYNDRINELFGNALFDVIDREGVNFHVTKENSYATYMSVGFINNIYRGWNITFSFDPDVAQSWILCTIDSISSMEWDGSVKVFKIDEKHDN